MVIPVELYGPVSAGGGFGSFLISINGDFTPPQILTTNNGTGFDAGFVITDAGLGVHYLRTVGFTPATSNLGPPISWIMVPPGVKTELTAAPFGFTVPEPGWYFITIYLAGDTNTPPLGNVNSRVEVQVNNVGFEACNYFDVNSANIVVYEKTMTCTSKGFVGGDTVQVFLTQDSPGAMNMSFVLKLTRVGSL